jgi:hypothetical protein
LGIVANDFQLKYETSASGIFGLTPEIRYFLGTALGYLFISSTKRYVIDFRPLDTITMSDLLKKFSFVVKRAKNSQKWLKTAVFGYF